MNNSAAAHLPLSSLDDDAWDDLLSFIDERRPSSTQHPRPFVHLVEYGSGGSASAPRAE
jgi:hypothetical protein